VAMREVKRPPACDSLWADRPPIRKRFLNLDADQMPVRATPGSTSLLRLVVDDVGEQIDGRVTDRTGDDVCWRLCRRVDLFTFPFAHIPRLAQGV
jgi:hypothetical protein